MVERFDEEVNTQSLASVSVTDDDFLKISHAMSKCSELSHDRPSADNSPPPPPEKIRQDIKLLDAFVGEIKKRNEFLQDKRRKLLKAPAPEIR